MNPGTAPVDQKRQYDDEQYSGYDPNDGYVIHVSFSFFLCLVEVFSERLGHNDGCRAQGYEEQGGENE